MIHSAIIQHAQRVPQQVALYGLDKAWTYATLNACIVETSIYLAKFADHTRIAIALHNQPAWVVLDIAALQLNLPQVPLPAFFSDAQLRHAIEDAGVTVLITDQPGRYDVLLADRVTHKTTIQIADTALTQYQLNTVVTPLAANTAKITYTSGTTGAPKGVCLSEHSMLQVAQAIQTAVNLNAHDQHLCVLPLSTLLENVAGVYASLLAGASIHIYPAEQVGFAGVHFDVKKLFSALALSQATTVILIPELLNALIKFCETEAAHAYATALSQLRFVAVGGAHVSSALLQRARALGLPVYEGYGLSESASVVTLNTPAAVRVGSVGKPLPHIAMCVADDNEILVKGANFIGYTHAPANLEGGGWMPTGDIGYCDADGFWFLQGRKKNMFITSFGRNVSPEWIELELRHLPGIEQACVFGEAKPWNVAVITLSQTFLSTNLWDNTTLAGSIAALNEQLPDYARIGQWLISRAPFSVENGQLTPNGRLKRDAIWQSYQPTIEALYAEKEHA